MKAQGHIGTFIGWGPERLRSIVIPVYHRVGNFAVCENLTRKGRRDFYNVVCVDTGLSLGNLSAGSFDRAKVIASVMAEHITSTDPYDKASVTKAREVLNDVTGRFDLAAAASKGRKARGEQPLAWTEVKSMLAA